MSDIREFQITWKRELFFKNKLTILKAKYLIRKSIVIGKNQQLNHLNIVHKLNKSLAKYLQERLEVLQNEIDDYNHQIKNLTEQEKDYWKQFTEIIEKRASRPVVVLIDKNNENIPPLEYKSMHKSYQPMFPTSNRILQKKWDDKNYSEHRILIRDARPSIDTRPPKTYMHLHMKLKKLQLEEERTATIERDNRILLEKMSQIMRTTSGIDNRNAYEPRSLNQEQRRKELLRVSKENATLAKRIIDCKTDGNRENWKCSWSKNAAYLDNLSKFDPDWHLTNSAVQEAYNGKPAVKHSKTVTREDKKGIKALVMTNETATTKTGNDGTQQ